MRMWQAVRPISSIVAPQGRTAGRQDGDVGEAQRCECSKATRTMYPKRRSAWHPAFSSSFPSHSWSAGFEVRDAAVLYIEPVVGYCGRKSARTCGHTVATLIDVVACAGDWTVVCEGRLGALHSHCRPALLDCFVHVALLHARRRLALAPQSYPYNVLIADRCTNTKLAYART